MSESAALIYDKNYVFDNRISFRHIRYPKVIVKNPKHVLDIYDTLNNKHELYGCIILPSLSELKRNILPFRIFECNPDLGFSDLDLNNYKLYIDGKEKRIING